MPHVALAGSHAAVVRAVDEREGGEEGRAALEVGPRAEEEGRELSRLSIARRRAVVDADVTDISKPCAPELVHTRYTCNLSPLHVGWFEAVIGGLGGGGCLALLFGTLSQSL